ncbi:MAG: hypothetical protein M3R57_11845 [Chloroflexota bacterium]|nr:hypothetical protein [Chloroflexota bacterium]
MMTETTPPRGTIMRSALAVALFGLAGLIGWVGLTRGSNQPVIVLIAALLPVAAAGLLFVRRALGSTLAVIAALVGALVGFLLSVCILCPAQPPLSAEAVALYVTALVIYVLALIELRTLGLVWVGLAVPVVILALSGNQIFIAVALLVIAVAVVWLWLRRRRSGRGASDTPDPSP